MNPIRCRECCCCEYHDHEYHGQKIQGFYCGAFDWLEEKSKIENIENCKWADPYDLKKGDVVFISGDSSELWLKDYNVRVSTSAIVEETPTKHAKKVLVTLDYIDHDSKVLAYVRKSKIQPAPWE